LYSSLWRRRVAVTIEMATPSTAWLVGHRSDWRDWRLNTGVWLLRSDGQFGLSSPIGRLSGGHLPGGFPV